MPVIYLAAGSGAAAVLLDTAHLVISMRTRSAPVSKTMVFSFTAQTVPVMPPMVVISSPTVRELRRFSASYFRLFSGRIMKKYSMANISTSIKIQL